MQKIKYELYKRIEADASLSRLELHFLFYLASHQDPSGHIDGVYYSDVCRALSCSTSGFYLVRDSLVQKQYIAWDKSAMSDMDVILYDNSFVTDGEVVYEDYVDINLQIFHDPDFWKCKAGAIRAAMYLVKRAGAKGAITMSNSLLADASEAEAKRKLWFRTGKELQTLSRLLAVTKRVVRDYLKQLQHFLSGCLIQKDGQSYQVITVHKKSLQHKRKYPEAEAYCQKVRTFCRRENITCEEKHLRDTADLIHQYKRILEKSGMEVITAICHSIRTACADTLNSYNTHAALRSLIKHQAPGLL